MPRDFTIAEPAPPVLPSDSFEIQRQKINNFVAAVTASTNFIGLANAWVTFNGDGTITPNASYGISSVVKTAVGSFRITLSRALSTSTPCVNSQLWESQVSGGEDYHIHVGELIEVVSTTERTVDIKIKQKRFYWRDDRNQQDVQNAWPRDVDVGNTKITLIISE